MFSSNHPPANQKAKERTILTKKGTGEAEMCQAARTAQNISVRTKDASFS